MRKAFVAVAFALLIASTSFAYRVVYDYDGDPLNGPDVIVGEVSDEVTLTVWLLGDPPLNLISFGSRWCNYDGSLEVVGHAYNAAAFPGWQLTPMTNPVPFCYELQGFGSAAVAIPQWIATITVHLGVDCSVDLIELDPANQGWFTEFYGTVVPEEMVGAEFVIGGTGTEESSWGAVKDLFR
jgi:hypothetical protein